MGFEANALMHQRNENYFKETNSRSHIIVFVSNVSQETNFRSYLHTFHKYVPVLTTHPKIKYVKFSSVSEEQINVQASRPLIYGRMCPTQVFGAIPRTRNPTQRRYVINLIRFENNFHKTIIILLACVLWAFQHMHIVVNYGFSIILSFEQVISGGALMHLLL